MVQRLSISRSTAKARLQRVLFTGSAFRAGHLRPRRGGAVAGAQANEAMSRGDEQCAHTAAGWVVATFQASLPRVGRASAHGTTARRDVELRSVFVPKAMQDLAEGRPANTQEVTRPRRSCGVWTSDARAFSMACTERGAAADQCRCWQPGLRRLALRKKGHRGAEVAFRGRSCGQFLTWR